MTEIEKQMLALVNEVASYECVNTSDACHADLIRALRRAIEQHEAFKREVSDAVELVIDDLLPCPFCGGEAHMPYYGDRVECRDCKGSVMTITAWNTRVADHPPTTNPVDDHETGNVSVKPDIGPIDTSETALVSDKLRDANKVAHEVCEEMEEYGPHFAAKVIEADRQAVRLAERQKIVAWLRDGAGIGASLAHPGVLQAIEAGEYER